MNSQQPSVGRYYDLLLSLPNERRFNSNFIGRIEPFFPSEDEQTIIQELRKRAFTNHRQGLENDLSISLDRNKTLGEYLSRDFPYHFERNYGENVFSPISVTPDSEADRMRVVDDLSEDLGHWDFIQYLNQLNEEYQKSGPVADKLEWTASPSAMGHLMSELADKGYIQPPRKPNGEIHYAAFAELLTKAFSGIKNSDFLAKTLSPDNEKGLSADNKKRFKIPDVKEIS